MHSKYVEILANSVYTSYELSNAGFSMPCSYDLLYKEMVQSFIDLNDYIDRDIKISIVGKDRVNVLNQLVVGRVLDYGLVEKLVEGETLVPRPPTVETALYETFNSLTTSFVESYEAHQSVWAGNGLVMISLLRQYFGLSFRTTRPVITTMTADVNYTGWEEMNVRCEELDDLSQDWVRVTESHHP